MYRKNAYARKILDMQRESEIKLANLIKVVEYDESKAFSMSQHVDVGGDDIDRVES